MRILYLTQWYLPEPATLQAELAGQLRDGGHRVTVLTGFPNYPAGRLYPGYRQRLWQRETIDGIDVLRVPIFPDHSGSAVRRAWNHASLALSTLTLAPWLLDRFDVIYGARPITLGASARWLSLLRGRPFVLEITDMWPEVLADTELLHRPRLISAIGRYCRWVYRKATGIRVDTPGFRENLIAKGVPAGKIHFVPDWVDTSLYRPRSRDFELGRRLGLLGRFNVWHAGTVGLSQQLETLLDAAEVLLRERPDVQFVFSGGRGVERDRLEALARSRGLTNCRFLGFIPFEELADTFAWADVMFVQLRDTPLSRITIPHKVYAYLSAGRPILAAVEGDTAELVRRHNAGVVCRPCDSAAIVAAIRGLVEMPDKLRDQMGENGRRAACEHYALPKVTARVVELLERVAACGGR